MWSPLGRLSLSSLPGPSCPPPDVNIVSWRGFHTFLGIKTTWRLVSTQLWRPIPINSHSLGLRHPGFCLPHNDHPEASFLPSPTPYTHFKEPRSANVQHLWKLLWKLLIYNKLMVNKHLEWMRVLLSSKDRHLYASVEMGPLWFSQNSVEKLGSSIPCSLIYYTNTVHSEHSGRTKPLY